MKRTSIKDIAQAVGVSNATVSLVLTGKAKNGRVSSEMAEKIRQAAKSMKYQPNRLARSLQSGRSLTVGLLIADIVNPFFGNMAFHIQEEMRKAGYAVIIMNTDEDNRQMEEMIELMRCRQVDGFIIAPAESGEQSVIKLIEDNVPLVLIDRCYPDIRTSNILIDNYDASYQATRHLIMKGCKNIALFLYDTKLPHMEGRKKGYIEALNESGLYKSSLIREVSYRDTAHDLNNELDAMFHGNEYVDGILFATNTIAVTGLKLLYKRDTYTPENIQIACFDKSEIFDFLPIPVTYIQQPIQNIACVATRLLLEQLEEVPAETSSYCLPAELITE